VRQVGDTHAFIYRIKSPRAATASDSFARNVSSARFHVFTRLRKRATLFSKDQIKSVKGKGVLKWCPGQGILARTWIEQRRDTDRPTDRLQNNLMRLDRPTGIGERHCQSAVKFRSQQWCFMGAGQGGWLRSVGSLIYSHGTSRLLLPVTSPCRKPRPSRSNRDHYRPLAFYLFSLRPVK